MGTVYSTLGARLDVLEMMDGRMQGADHDLVKIWQKMNAPRFDNIMLKTKTVGARALPEGIEVTFVAAEEGGTAPPRSMTWCRKPWAAHPMPRRLPLRRQAWRLPTVVSSTPTFRCAPRTGLRRFQRPCHPTSVAHTNPEVAWVGLTEDQAKAQGIKVRRGLFPWNASGRAIANGRFDAVTKLLFDDFTEAHGHGHGKILGGGRVGTRAGDMIGELALAIEMGADAIDIGKTIHPHPALGESIGMAAEVAHGSCTDLPPARK